MFLSVFLSVSFQIGHATATLMLHLTIEQLEVNEAENYFIHVVGMAKKPNLKIPPVSRHRTEVQRKGESPLLKFKSGSFSFQVPPSELADVANWELTLLLNVVKTSPTTVQQVGRATFQCAKEGTQKIAIQSLQHPFGPVASLCVRWNASLERPEKGTDVEDTKYPTLPSIASLCESNCMLKLT